MAKVNEYQKELLKEVLCAGSLAIKRANRDKHKAAESLALRSLLRRTGEVDLDTGETIHTSKLSYTMIPVADHYKISRKGKEFLEQNNE